MRIIAFSTLRGYAARHADAKSSLTHWHAIVKEASFGSMSELQAAFPKAKVLNADRVRFPVGGGRHRLIVALDFERQIAFVKFLGTHEEHDAVDACTISQF
ncbi:type II toxin-antitoxin system HigB family toxin [Methylobacterium sp. B4]|uniref:type II toxin-antitoxin system HigB family toxin n=1 Tax=Methylobacterium sp. B4 TaxID=1938755 RepID=UPI000D7684E0|nr:type II toxin-antitoxin system HigB family toxin [Methylobacterium sp. B4]PXW65974.1 mRNA interferase HigB [Methylobacterium sp. B4]